MADAHPQALLDLQALYSQVDSRARALGLACSACGRCCDFAAAGHVLYASALEVGYLLSRDGRPGRARSAGACPFQAGAACTARGGRVLGCRLHFCDVHAATRLALEELSAWAHVRLKAIHDGHGIAWQYRPLLGALEVEMA